MLNELIHSTAEMKMTPEQKEAILQLLEDMLAHHSFKNSKRCTSLLRYQVQQALEDPTAHIKERTLGIEVFGREANYDTASDPVVRIAMNEVRKRIAQYNDEVVPRNGLRLEVPVGAYMPKFQFVSLPPELEAPADPSIEGAIEADGFALAAPPSSLWHSRRLRSGSVAAVIALVLLAGLVYYRWHNSPFAQLWSPLLSSSHRILICIGTGLTREDSQKSCNYYLKPDTAPLQNAQIPGASSDIPTTNDVGAISKLIGYIQSQKKAYVLQPSALSTLRDLRSGPVILFGVANNAWTRCLTSSLRFHIEDDSASKVIRVIDSSNQNNKDWLVDMNQNNATLTKDYALVSRYTDDLTQTPVLEVAGLRVFGSIAATEFVSDPRYMNAMGKMNSSCKRNAQFVLQTTIVNGTSGPPKILAMHCW
jgi:hypothetical protein